MADESKARKLHKKALKLREQKYFLESLKVGEDALFEYAKDNDTLGFSELLSMQAKTYLHAFSFTKYKPYLELAKSTAKACVSIAESMNDTSATMLPYFNLGDIAEDTGDLSLAISSYKKAVDILENNPSERHNRKSVLANFKIHLHTSEYKNGDKSALIRAEKALNNLHDSKDASDYEKHVWESGAHMRIALMLKTDNPNKAKTHLQKAKTIIDSDPELIIRKEQWEKLSSLFEKQQHLF
jgi:tetratricopeptide (TPR) repeat protein